MSNAMKGLVGSSSGFSRIMPEATDHSLDFTEPWQGTPLWRGGRSSSTCSSERWKIQGSAERDARTMAQRNRYRVTAACQVGAHECSRPCRRASRTPRRLFRVLDILKVKWATFLFPRGLSIPPHYVAHVLEERKRPPIKNIDDDEESRSLREAQKITADILEERVIYDQEGVDLPKVMSHDDSLHSAKEKLQPSRQHCANSELAGRCRSPRHFPQAHL